MVALAKETVPDEVEGSVGDFVLIGGGIVLVGEVLGDSRSDVVAALWSGSLGFSSTDDIKSAVVAAF